MVAAFDYGAPLEAALREVSKHSAPVTREQAYARANEFNLFAGVNSIGGTYWAVVVMYHWVIYVFRDGATQLAEIVGPVAREAG